MAKFPRRTSTSSGFHAQAQQSEEQLQQQQQQQTPQQQAMAQSSNSDQSSAQASGLQLPANNGVANVNNSLNAASASTSAGTIVGLLHQNSMTSRHQNSVNASSPYGGNSAQIPSPGSSSTIPQAQANPSTFQSPTPSSSNNPPQAPHGALVASNHMNSANSPVNMTLQQPALSGEADPSESQSSVQKIIHEIMSGQLNGTGGMGGSGSLGSDVKGVNGMLPTSNNTVLNGGNGLVGNNGTVNNNSGIGGGGFGSMGNGLGQSAIVNGIRAAMGNNPVMNGRVGMTSMARDQGMNHQQHELGNQLLSGLGAVNGFNNLQFDWKPSP